MSDPIQRTENAQAPIPILGEPALDQNGQIERTWKNAPSIVRDVRLLAVLGIILNVILVIVGTIVVFTSMIADDSLGNGAPGYLVAAQIGEVVAYAALIVLQVWIIKGLRPGKRAVWITELVLAILGIAAIGIGTIISIYILVKWLQPETKRWFGFEV